MVDTVIQAGMGLFGAENAEDAQVEGQRDALGYQREMFEYQKEINEPYRSVGGAALSELSRMTLGYDPTSDAYKERDESLSRMQTREEKAAKGGYDPTAELDVLRRFASGEQGGKLPSKTWKFLRDFGYVGSDHRNPYHWARPGVAQGYLDKIEADNPYFLMSEEERAALAQGQAGGSADNRLGYDDRMAGFYESPDYQFRVDEGLKALERQAAAQGNLVSGAQMKAAQRYGQQMGSQEYANYYNRLANLAGTGQTAVANLQNAAANASSQVSGTMKDIGDVRASGFIAQAQNINQGIGNLQQQAAQMAGMMSGGGMRGF